jgi:hypothetical protein
MSHASSWIPYRAFGDAFAGAATSSAAITSTTTPTAFDPTP